MKQKGVLTEFAIDLDEKHQRRGHALLVHEHGKFSDRSEYVLHRGDRACEVFFREQHGYETKRGAGRKAAVNGALDHGGVWLETRTRGVRCSVEWEYRRWDQSQRFQSHRQDDIATSRRES